MEQKQPFSLDDFTAIEVKCSECGAEGHQLTLKAYLESDTPIAKMYENKGYVPVICGDCNNKNLAAEKE